MTEDLNPPRCYCPEVSEQEIRDKIHILCGGTDSFVRKKSKIRMKGGIKNGHQ